MLGAAHELAGDSGMVIHSDRGFHYRIPAWIERMSEYGYVRSMSRKGCSPDNSACEGFFGTMKVEFLYPNDLSSATVDEFIPALNDYLTWFKEKMVKRGSPHLRYVLMNVAVTAKNWNQVLAEYYSKKHVTEGK